MQTLHRSLNLAVMTALPKLTPHFYVIPIKVLIENSGKSNESGGEWIHAYVWLSTFAVHLKLSQHR